MIEYNIYENGALVLILLAGSQAEAIKRAHFWLPKAEGYITAIERSKATVDA